MASESFEKIHLDLSKESGKCKFAESGFGWKPSGGGELFTLDHTYIASAQWSRAAKGYEVRILHRTNSSIIQLDGFQQEDYERLAKLFKNWYSTNLENKEHSLRGWNWGKAAFNNAELTFNVANRPAFEIPYSEIANTNLAGRNEVAIEFAPAGDGDGSGGTRGKSRKAGAGKDQIVEMRFYIPNNTATTRKGADADADGVDAEEEKTAAALFHDTVVEKAEIGDSSGEAIAKFGEVLHLTPRGRFEIHMYESSFRMRGKTYDYKIQYEAVKKFMVLPKPDDVHIMICLGLDPPLRQGQTRYPFVVMQSKRDEEAEIPIELTDEDLETKYKDKLEKFYALPLHQVLARVFKGLANKKITKPAKDFVTSRQQLGVKCSIKASEGFLYLLEKAFMFVPKPTMYIAYDNTQSVTFSRVSGAVTSLSTFDITVLSKNDGGSTQFSNINREDLKAMEDFFKLKGMRIKNEIDEDAKLVVAMRDQPMDDSSDDEAPAKGAGGGADRGSADEDDENPDEDFVAESESDVAEEFDSEHDSWGSGSDDSGVDNNGNDEDMDDGDGRVKEPPKKKKKKT